MCRIDSKILENLSLGFPISLKYLNISFNKIKKEGLAVLSNCF
jgi:hypothetical protein